MNAYVNQYQNTQFATASPEQILIMLYDGAIRFVRQARNAIEADDRKTKIVAIDKAMAIVLEFSNSLDREVGGDIAEDLARLYDFVVRELVAVNIRNEVDRLDSVEKVLSDLREGFAGAIEINQRGNQSVAASA